MRFHTAMVGATMLMVSTSSVAQDASENQDVDIAAILKDLQSEVQGLRDDNASMRGEIEELRILNQDEWITERRSEEIRGIVQDVLADADTRASLQGNGLSAGWSNGFFLASPDGRFRLNIGGQMQTRFVWNYHDEPDTTRYGFENTRTKLLFDGHVFSPDWEFSIETDFARDGGSATLLDSWIRHNFNNEISLRAGQFKMPFSRESLVDASQQLVIERSLIDLAMGVGRTQGIELRIENPVHRILVAVTDGSQDNLGSDAGFTLARTQRPFPLNSPALVEDVEYAFAARYELLMAGNWNQFKDFTSSETGEYGVLFGVAFQGQESEYGTPTADDVDWVAWTADISMEFGGASLFASFTHHYIDRVTFTGNIYGVVGQGSIYITPKLEFYARYEYGWTDFNLAVGSIERSDLGVLTIGTNYYLDGHDLKWSTDLGIGFTQVEDFWSSDRAGYRADTEDSEPQFVLRTQLQLLF
ncbi:MAG: porin [Planctomycetota bacterium]|nr:porin [Planctomycetota bacterium]